MLVISRADVEAVLDLDGLVDAMRTALIDLSAGRAAMPPRVAAMVPQRDGLLAAMPASLPSMGALTTKLVSVFPRNDDRPTHQAVICCFDPDSGSLLAVIDGTYITAARTAAGSTLATRLLARPDAAVVSVIGTGVQARAHAVAHARLPAVATIQIAGRDERKVGSLVAQLSGIDVEVVGSPSIEDAVRTADIVCATTHAAAPVVRREWLRPGTHVNSVGIGGSGEVDRQTVTDAMVVVESRSSALAPPPSGAVEFQDALAAGVDEADLVHAEIGEIAAGTKPGRPDAEVITLYKSVGVAVQDAAAAALVLDAAVARGIGVEVDV